METSAPKSTELEQRLAGDPRAHWFTVVIDREGYSPDLFLYLWKKRIALLTYHKFSKDDWRLEEFSSHSVTLI